MDPDRTWLGSIIARAEAPEPEATVTAWADAHRFLDTKNAAEPGLWRTSRTPYLRAIMDDLSTSSPVERVIFMKGTQVGSTEAGNNFLGYIIDRAPGPAMAVLPTVEMAKRTSKQRIDPLIESSPVLRRKVAPARSRDSGNTVLMKEYPGGVLILTGANSAVGLRSMPVRFLFLDEVDAYPQDADREGDPIALAVKRTDTFNRRKIYIVSTPTVEGASRIEAEFLATDQRRYFVPCRHCGEVQTLKWAQVRWTELGLPPEKAAYLCEHCGAVLEEHDKPAMLAAGEWRPTAAGTTPRARGYHLSALYSPWFTWGQAAIEFLAARKAPARLKTWTNTVLGETWREADEAPDWRRLFERREGFAQGLVPTGALVVTAGVDVQNDRLEVQLVAWGRGFEAWVIDYAILSGSPAQPAVWTALERILDRPLDHAGGGVLPLARMAIDTGGHHTSEAYGFARGRPRVMACKGSDRTPSVIGTPSFVEVSRNGRRIRRGVQLWPVGVSLIKGQLYERLRLPLPVEGEAKAEGLIHLARFLDAEYFRQLTAERRVRRVTKTGAQRTEWEATRERNEVLDTLVLATAAAYGEGLQRWKEADWQAAEAAIGLRRPEPAAAPLPAPAEALRPGATIRSGWMTR